MIHQNVVVVVIVVIVVVVEGGEGGYFSFIFVAVVNGQSLTSSGVTTKMFKGILVLDRPN